MAALVAFEAWSGVPQSGHVVGEFELDPSIRGVPPDAGRVSAREVAAQGWRPASGLMNLPVLTLDVATLEANWATMLAVCADSGVAIAPHAKTPMAPRLTSLFTAAGARGISVADLRQAYVMLEAGHDRVLIANQIGGPRAAHRLATLRRSFPEANLSLFVDTPEIVRAIAEVWRREPGLAPIDLLVEVGCGRGGVHTDAEADAVCAALAETGCDRVRCAGVAAYEGTLNTPDPRALDAALDDLFRRIDGVLVRLRASRDPERPLLLSIGGSTLFDHVIVRSRDLSARYSPLDVVLRSGACLFGDHGLAAARMEAMADRGLLGPSISERLRGGFRPALRLWAEVLSLQSSGLAICGLGLRDAGIDQGLPVPLALWQEGRRVANLHGAAAVEKCNDQHAFVLLGAARAAVGDVVEFGVRHPCSNLQNHRAIFATDARGEVVDVYETYFG